MIKVFSIVAMSASILAATALATAAPSPTLAAAPDRAQQAQAPNKQPVVSGFYRGKTVRYFDFGPIKLHTGNKIAPIWAVTNGANGQHNIIDTVPGQKSYSPLWQVNKVTWKAGVTPRVLKSATAVKRAAADGEVAIASTATVVNCPVLGFGQKVITGFSAGHAIHYYDLGPAKVAPGNDVVPLYAVTNGVGGQHNVAGDTIAVGQTAYPPLWSILQVTWEAGATPRLLTSYAAIVKARDAGEVTIEKTSLVVNCPLV